MLWRLVAKLLLKATVPLIALAGIFTYGVYMRGGDPGAMWKNIASRGGAQVTSLFSGARQDANRALGAVSGELKKPGAGAAEKTEVFTWQDAEGVTHYSTSAPVDIDARTMSVDPNVNVLAPVRKPVAAMGTVDEGGDSTNDLVQPSTGENLAQPARSGGEYDSNTRAVIDELGGSLPGVAGQVLSSQSAGESGAAMDPAQLVRMLQSGTR